VEYRDLREGIHSITLNGRRKELGGAIIPNRENCARGKENCGRQDRLHFIFADGLVQQA